MAGEFGDPTERRVQEDWEREVDEAQVGQEQEVMRKLRKITFIQRGEDDAAEVEQVRMELDKARSRTRAGMDSEDGNGDEDDTGEDFEVNKGAVAEGEAGWETFLPQRQLRVLLMEDDDSTRHVVGALLRNCRYEVTPASNGLQAWELLESGHQQYDMVLTDVVMPGLSGISLLTRIMTMETQRRVPVIMMSSHDSMDLVLNCFQKGAADFLVKPVRKNELKNIWQHVWRKCNSSSGSGSGSGGSQTGKMMAKSRVGSGNESGNSDDDGGNGSGSGSSLNVRGSDNGSGTQNDGPLLQARDKKADKKRGAREETSGGTTSNDPVADPTMGKGLEIGPPRTRSTANQMAVPQLEDDGEQTTPEGPSLSPEERQSSDEEEADRTGTSMPEIGASSPLVVAIDLLGSVGTLAKKAPEPADDVGQATEGKLGQAEGGIGVGEVVDRRGSNSPKEEEEPILELTLKRPREDEVELEDRKVLRQSGASAFSRYAAGQQQGVHPPPGTIPSVSYPLSSHFNNNPLSPRRPSHRATGSNEITTPVPVHPRLLNHNATDLSSPQGLSPTESSYHAPGIQSEEAAMADAPPLLSPQGVGMGMTMRTGPGPGTMLSFDGMRPPYAAFGAAFYGARGPPSWAAPPHARRGEMEAYERAPYVDSPYGESPRLSRPHPHHHHHHGQHHVPHHHQHQLQHGPSVPSKPAHNGPPAVEPLPAAVKEAVPLVPDSANKGSGSNGSLDGSNTNLGSGGGSGSGGNGAGSIINVSSGNGSASGSNNGSNGQNGNSNGTSNGQSAVATALMAVDTEGGENGNNGSSGVENGVSHGTNGASNGATTTAGNNNGMVVGPVQNRSARREAALNKFRQKRKERCFEKKVRYQSRKRLAEQRPRIRGQFVRQTALAGGEGQ